MAARKGPFLNHRNVIELRVANPEFYINGLRECYKLAADGQLYDSPRERTHGKGNSVKLSLIFENDEVWDCTCVAWVEMTQRTVSHWRKVVKSRAMPYIDDVLLPEWNARAQAVTGDGNLDNQRGLWRLHSMIGWRVTDHAIFDPKPGLYVVIE